MGRGIPTDNIPKHYFKDGNIYETKTKNKSNDKTFRKSRNRHLRQ